MGFDIYIVHGVSANLQGSEEWKVSLIQLTRSEVQKPHDSNYCQTVFS